MYETLLNLVVFLPLAAAIVIAFVPREMEKAIKWGAFGASLVTFLISVALLPGFNADRNADYQFITAAPWVQQFGVQYKIGVDGISLVLLLLTTLLSAISILSSFDAIRERVREYYVFLLLLETGMLGVFVSLDLILFYVFWEAMLIPMYFLIGIWGGPRKLYATIKFVLYTLVGSLLMLVAIIWLYAASSKSVSPATFDLVVLTDPSVPIRASPALDPGVRLWLFLA